MKKGFLTLAFGKALYIQMAKALAISMRLHGLKSPLAIVTDTSDLEINHLFDKVIKYNPSYGSGVSQKIHVDLYTPFEETIFIDSDCLVYKNPELLWNTYKTNQPFGIMGAKTLTSSDQHYAVNNLKVFLKILNLSKMHDINTGIFYFDNTAMKSLFFEKCREIYNDRDRLPFKVFKDSPVNDEPIFAAALEILSINPLKWDEVNILGFASGKLKNINKINVLNGNSYFIRDGLAVHPMVIHFHVYSQNFFIYRREIKRLEIQNKFIADLLSLILLFPKCTIFSLRYSIRKTYNTFIFPALCKSLSPKSYEKLSSIAKKILNNK